MCIETILYARTRHGIVNIENGILISNTRMYFFVDNELCQNKTGDAFHFFYNSFQMLDDFQNLTGPKIRKMMKRTPADS
jgi:hypothetical protein